MGEDGHLMLIDAARPSRRRHTISSRSLSIVLLLGLALYFQLHVIPLYFASPTSSETELFQFQVKHLNAGLDKCTAWNTKPIEYVFPINASRQNPRWHYSEGQDSILLRNTTLFDGEEFWDEPVNIKFTKGIVISITPTREETSQDVGIKSFEMHGRYVTPGLVDMHSHHLIGSWPQLSSTDDVNEMNTDIGAPLTPFVRALDSLKAYDPATTIIASGGVTSSLLLPGSANIIGGEGFMVKNVLRSGKHGEEVVEELLLEHGIPIEERRRYLKMACGENPKMYQHTRMGNAWILRKHLARAQTIREKQDGWCLSAAAARKNGNLDSITKLISEKLDGGDLSLTKELEMDSTIAMLRGNIGVNIHCYEPEDFEDMLLHSKEFGFKIQAFHHALSAWKVPEMIKNSGQNITIATFAEFGLIKKEAYDSNLWAGKILAENGVPVAYKSDHSMQELNAKHLIFQAATAHSFQLPEVAALKSVTSIPARSVGMDHRVGYIRAGYDADIVVWDSHPLSVGATPLQVYIDGKATLDQKTVAESLSRKMADAPEDLLRSSAPPMRQQLSSETRAKLCGRLEAPGAKIVITGISKSYLTIPSAASPNNSKNHTMVLEHGQITCFGSASSCLAASTAGTTIELKNGHVLPGLTAVSANLGLTEMRMVENAGDGDVSVKSDTTNPDNVVYAKDGIHLNGKAFARARIGGVTKAITSPMTPLEGNGFIAGVSVGIRTSGNKTILDGGIFSHEVALHILIGQGSKSDTTPTISSAIAKLRSILSDNEGKDNIYGRVVNGSLPLVVQAENEYDIMQLITLKNSSTLASLNLVIQGGSGAPLVAHELAAAKMPIILTAARAAPDSWEKKNALPGPPLSLSPAQVLTDAGVTFAIALAGFSDAHVHNLLVEASWAAKYAGIGKKAAVDLVSSNVEKILGLQETSDFVVWEGDPLEFGATVVMAVDGEDGKVMTCWPDAE